MIHNELPHEQWYLEWRDQSHLDKLAHARRGVLTRPCLRTLRTKGRYGIEVEITPRDVNKCFFDSSELAWRLLDFTDIEDVKKLCHAVLDAAKMYNETEYHERRDIIENHDYNAAVPINGTWQEWISQIIKGMEKHNLEPHNFGDFYYLYDLSAGEKIEFPKDKIQRESKIGNRFLTGKILRVMPKS